MKKSFFALLAALTAGLTLSATAPASAAEAEVYTGRFNNLAVEGHDPVAYFTAGEPVRGSRDFELTHKGATWRFSSAENLATFQADPDRYAPQYGGYCAWAASQGYTARGNANNWTIVNDKLYLNYNDKVQKTWLTDPEGFIELADQNWPAILEG